MPTPPPVNGGYKEVGKKYFLPGNPGDKQSYYCKKGYILKGDAFNKCQYGGVWKYEKPPTCERAKSM